MRGCLAPPKNSAQTTGRGMLFCPADCSGKDTAGKEASICPCGGQQVAENGGNERAVPRREQSSSTTAEGWAQKTKVGDLVGDSQHQPALGATRLENVSRHPSSHASSIIFSVLLCASVFQDPSLLDTQPFGQHRGTEITELERGVASARGVRHSPVPLLARCSFLQPA